MQVPPAPLEPTGPLEGLRVGAIALGVIVDNVATFLVGIILMVVMAASSVSGEPSEEALEAVTASSEFLVAFALLGTMCTVLGGYVAAQRAGAHHVRHGAWVGVVGIVLGVISYSLPQSREAAPLWLEALGFLVVVPAGMVGGTLSLKLGGG